MLRRNQLLILLVVAAFLLADVSAKLVRARVDTSKLKAPRKAATRRSGNQQQQQPGGQQAQQNPQQQQQQQMPGFGLPLYYTPWWAQYASPYQYPASPYYGYGGYGGYPYPGGYYYAPARPSAWIPYRPFYQGNYYPHIPGAPWAENKPNSDFTPLPPEVTNPRFPPLAFVEEDAELTPQASSFLETESSAPASPPKKFPAQSWTYKDVAAPPDWLVCLFVCLFVFFFFGFFYFFFFCFFFFVFLFY